MRSGSQLSTVTFATSAPTSPVARTSRHRAASENTAYEDEVAEAQARYDASDPSAESDQPGCSRAVKYCRAPGFYDKILGRFDATADEVAEATKIVAARAQHLNEALEPIEIPDCCTPRERGMFAVLNAVVDDKPEVPSRPYVNSFKKARNQLEGAMRGVEFVAEDDPPNPRVILPASFNYALTDADVLTEEGEKPNGVLKEHYYCFPMDGTFFFKVKDVMEHFRISESEVRMLC